MNVITLEKINKEILDLVDAKSNKQLHSQIIEIAIALIAADYGKLYLYKKKDRLKRIYFSNEFVKRNALVLNKSFLKLLSTEKMITLDQEELHAMKIKLFPPEIKFFVCVPLLHTQHPLGYIFLYFLKDKKNLTPSEQELLTLYTHTVVLALTKAKLQEESQKALEIRDRFISLVSHELRTPLTSIHGYIQLLYTRMRAKKTLESHWMNELYVESIRMTQLVKELLDVNRIKQGQFAFVFSEVPLKDVIKRAIERYRLTNAEHPFVFESQVNGNEPTVVGDFDKLVEMVSGLLGNAVKFSKPGEKIIITLSQTQKTVSLEVKDTGKGISKKDIAAVFNGFYKPENESYIEGMGVGLLLARHIVDNHRGKLKIKSKENKGTAVTVSLPTIKSSYE